MYRYPTYVDRMTDKDVPISSKKLRPTHVDTTSSNSSSSISSSSSDADEITVDTRTSRQSNYLKTGDANTWFTDFASVIIVENYFNNQTVYENISKQPDGPAVAIMRKHLKKIWKLTSLPVPSPTENAETSLTMTAKNKQHVFNSKRVIGLVNKLRDRKSNTKARAYMLAKVKEYRRNHYEQLPVVVYALG